MATGGFLRRLFIKQGLSTRVGEIDSGKEGSFAGKSPYESEGQGIWPDDRLSVRETVRAKAGPRLLGNIAGRARHLPPAKPIGEGLGKSRLLGRNRSPPETRKNISSNKGMSIRKHCRLGIIWQTGFRTNVHLKGVELVYGLTLLVRGANGNTG